MSKKLAIKDMDHVLLGNLDHFIDQGGYPVLVTEDEAKLIQKHLPWLKVQKQKTKDDKYVEFVKKQKVFRNYSVCLTTKGIPSDVLAEYWKFRYEEQHERYEELYNKIKDLSENY